MADQTGTQIEERGRSKRIGALATLWPFVRPYRKLLAAALARVLMARRVFGG